MPADTDERARLTAELGSIAAHHNALCDLVTHRGNSRASVPSDSAQTHAAIRDACKQVIDLLTRDAARIGEAEGMLTLEMRRTEKAEAERDEARRLHAEWDRLLATQTEALRTTEAERDAARKELAETEEREAACCPEDVGFDECIATLRKELGAARKEAEDLERQRDEVGQTATLLDLDRMDAVDRADRAEAALREAERPRIVCLCGSTRFMQAFQEANLRETIAGRIVLSVGCNTKSDADIMVAGGMTPAEKEALDALHKRKIDLADEILVLNVGGYIGSSTRSEIAHARATGKPIRWLEPVAAPSADAAKEG